MEKKVLKKNNKAFSLLEVLLAIILLALIATPILQAIFATMAINKESKDIMAATEVATGITETFGKSNLKDINNQFTLSNIVSGNFGQYKVLGDMWKTGTSQAVISSTGTGTLPDSFICHFTNMYYRPHVSNNNFVYDIEIRFEKITPTVATDKYYTYNETITIFEHTDDSSEQFKTKKLCVINSSIMNE